MSLIQVRLTITQPSAEFVTSGWSLIEFFDRTLKPSGGGCRGYSTETEIVAEVSGGSEELVRREAHQHAEWRRDVFPDVEVTVDTNPAPLQDIQCTPKDVMRPTSQRLTKRFLLAAPTGAFILANTLRFREEVAPSEMRLQQWERVCNSGAAQLTCMLFASAKNCETATCWWRRSNEAIRAREALKSRES